MRALAVIESTCGATARVADAFAAGIREQMGATPSTRRDAARQAAATVVATGPRLWERLEVVAERITDLRPATPEGPGRQRPLAHPRST